MKKLVSKSKLIGFIPKMRKVRALVVGDVILDHYIWGSADRLSPEAPIPVVLANKEEYFLGGASNVAHNISALGAKVSICGTMGADFYSQRLKSLLKNKKIAQDLLIADKTRPTTLKTRVIAQRQQAVRIDWESCEFLSSKVNKEITALIRKNINKFDVVIIEDYGKGVVNPTLLEELVCLCRKSKTIITVDPKEEHLDYYKGVTALTPNLKEAEYAVGIKARNSKDLSMLAKMLLDRLNPQALLITLGDKGMKLFLEGGKSFHLPTYALEVFDVSGAGDTVIAVFSLALASGASFLEAAALSNFAAGIVVGRLGVAVTNPAELKKKILSH
ncbi:MAG: D-glycero-beta-D-manno-heptose-7-phosphate kinase [Candidatus Omnitrophica bacterium]|nr:D-glycero-beta-D-manno-heptose-7-phosphate kinase [Candidatus Omnitrophota bacterium]